MITYFSYILLSSLWCLGVYVSAGEGMVLYRLTVYMDKKALGKPIITCIACMASVHTAIVMAIGHYLLGIEFNAIKQAIGVYLLAVPAVAFLNTILWITLTKISGGELD